MPTATVTSKGQITIPKEVRDALHIETGDRVLFCMRHGGIVELRPQNANWRDRFGMLHRKGRKSVSVEEMNEAIAREAARRNR